MHTRTPDGPGVPLGLKPHTWQALSENGAGVGVGRKLSMAMLMCLLVARCKSATLA